MSFQQAQPFSIAQIDKSSPLPYHYQLREIIRSEITSNDWHVGDQLPSERELCETFNVSRTTVREALDWLVTDGFVRREKGLGTFIADPIVSERWSGSVIGFSDSITEQGYLIETRVLDLKTIEAPHHIREELFLESHEKLFLLRRHRFIQHQPILVVNSYLPEHLFPGFADIDFSDRSLYQTLRSQYDIHVARAKRSIEAIAAPPDLARLLEVETGFPIMYLENTAFDSDGTPIEFYKAWRRGDRSRFQFEYSLDSI